MPQEVTPQQFSSSVSTGVTLVDFYTTTCGPCRQLAPILAQVEREFGGRLQVVKVNLDHAGSFTQQMGIQVVPTLMLYVDGERVDTRQGMQSPHQLRQMVQPYV